MVSTAGAGDSNDQANWHKAYAENNLPRHYDWLGNDHDTVPRACGPPSIGFLRRFTPICWTRQ